MIISVHHHVFVFDIGNVYIVIFWFIRVKMYLTNHGFYTVIHVIYTPDVVFVFQMTIICILEIQQLDVICIILSIIMTICMICCNFIDL